jgi:ABC-2 type transport system permease protein
MRLLLRSALFHFQTHWSNQAHFWSGVIGMMVNNSLTLLGIWAMLFAGKEALNQERDVFFVMNFLLMAAWGVVHVFLGGIGNLDKQINEGGLDLALTTPRSPFLMLSLTSSSLPAWGDLALGIAGLFAYAIKQHSFSLFLNGFLIGIFATLTVFSFFLAMGTLAFWFRRTEAAYSVLVNMFLAFNTYPVVNTSGGMRWVLFLMPALMTGMIPAHYILAPSWAVLAAEAVGSVLLFFLAKALFHLGMRKYQSSSVLGIQRM